MEAINKRGQIGAYLLFLIILIAITILGYFAFIKFAAIKDLGTLSIFIVALIAGVATFFSPCSFALLPGYLSYYAVRIKGKNTLLYGIIAAAGLVAFNVLLGAVVAIIGLAIGKEFSIAAGGTLSGITLTIRTVVGLLLVFLGIAQLMHLPILAGLAARFAPKTEKASLWGLFVYGFGYNLANIGCTGPILTGLIVLTLPSGLSNVIAAFVVYSLTMALLMIIVSAIVGIAKEKVSRMAAFTPKIQKLSAIVLMAVGIFILLTVIFAKTFIKLFFP